MDYLIERLEYYDKNLFKKVLEIFIKEKGNIDDSTNIFLSSILDVKTGLDIIAVQNAINFARSHFELGKKFNQSFLNKILIASFKFPQIVHQVFYFSKFYDNNNWIFNSIIKLQKLNSNLFKNSIKNSHPIWDFLITQFDNDIKLKNELINVFYEERIDSFLFECIIFGWEMDQKIQVSIKNILLDIIQFCLTNESNISDQIINYCFYFYPELIIDNLGGNVHKLNIISLELAIYLKFHLKDTFFGNNSILAYKLIGIDLNLAKELIKNSNEIDQQIFQEILEQYDENNNKFILS